MNLNDFSVEVIRLGKDTILRNTDYTFEKVKEFERVKEHLRFPKIGSRWVIAVVKFTMPQLREILENLSPHVDYLIYASDVDQLKEEYPQYFKEEMDSYSRYLDVLSTFPLVFEKNASRELFKRSRGNIDLIRETLAILLEEHISKDIIVKRDVEAVILPDDTVYARDVALSLLLGNNEHIPKRGSYLSRYRYGYWKKLYEKYSSSLDENMAFYALRKYMYNLYERKLLYLTESGYECKDMAVIKVVDVYTISYIRIMFEQSSPKQLYSLLLLIEERIHNANSIIKPIGPYRD